MQRFWRELRKNWYLLGMATAIVLALLLPGAGEVVNPGGATSTTAVVIIFILAGLGLPSEEMRKGLANWKAHAYLQTFIFGVCGAWFYFTGGFFGDVMDGQLLVGLYALGVLPTTISSCIVFTQMARGNVATTIFNAVGANLAGVFLSPLLLTLMLRDTAGTALPWSEASGIFLRLLLKVLLPFVAGQILHWLVTDWARRYKTYFSKTSALLILLVIFLAFTRAARSEVLRTHVWTLWLPFAYLAGSNLLLMALAWGGAKAARLGPRNVASAVFVGPQKTLAMGVPLLGTYFADQPDLLPFAMLPILFYHPWQLLAAGVVRRLVTVPEAQEQSAEQPRATA